MGYSAPLKSTVLLYTACSEKSNLSATKLKTQIIIYIYMYLEKIVNVILQKMFPNTKADANK